MTTSQSPSRHYDGDPDVPFGGPPFGTRRLGAPVPPARPAARHRAAPWPTAAQRSGAAPAARPRRRARRSVPTVRHALGAAVLLLGVVGPLVAAVPVVGAAGRPLAVLGLVAGVLGTVRRARPGGRGLAVAGTVLCVLGLVVALADVAVLAGG